MPQLCVFSVLLLRQYNGQLFRAGECPSCILDSESSCVGLSKVASHEAWHTKTPFALFSMMKVFFFQSGFSFVYMNKYH